MQNYNKVRSCANQSTKNTLKKQQWAKSLSYFTAVKLLQNCPDSPLYKSYFNTITCSKGKRKTFDMDTGQVKITSTYCKNRWCYYCNRIRIAVNINHYLPQIEKLVNPCFVTLTMPTCKEEELRERLEHYNTCWRKIYQNSYDKRKKEVAEKDITLNGVRSIECTLRPNGLYHIHMHLIIEGWHNAEWVVKKWLKLHPEARRVAQDIRPIYVKNEAEPLNIGGLMEVFKYALKMSVNVRKNDDYKRMDKVFQAFKGRKLLNAFGSVNAQAFANAKEEEEAMNLVAQNAGEELAIRLGTKEQVFIWQPDIYDWVDKSTGEMLVAEPLPEKIHNIVKEAESLPEPKNVAQARKILKGNVR